MKKTLTLTAITLLAGAVTGYSQGIISLADTGSTFAIQIFGPQSLAASKTTVVDGAYTAQEEMGDTANGNLSNPGSATYTGSPLGAGYTVQLLAAAGTQTTYAALTPVSAQNNGIVTTWFTGGLAGFWNTGNVALVPSTTSTVAIAAWYSGGGDATLAAAQADPTGKWGISALETLTVSSSTGDTPAGFLADPPMTSFSLFQNVAASPEPSTIALGVMGASAFLFRRKK